MRRYETIIIIDSEKSREHLESIIKKLDGLIAEHSGLMIETDDWGKKKLAYEIKKKTRGHYIRFDFCSKISMIQEMERFFKIDYNILKFMTVVIDKNADIEAIKTSISQIEQSKTEDVIASDLPKNESNLPQAEADVNGKG